MIRKDYTYQLNLLIEVYKCVCVCVCVCVCYIFIWDDKI